MFKAKALTKLNIGYAIKFLLLLTLATGAPLVGIHSQWITGPVVNMALILAVFLVGIRGALLIGILPSTIALGTGLLPAVLAPMIPFIIISNTILILVIDKFKSTNYQLPITNYWIGLFFAAALKYLFLFITSGLVINLLLKQELALKVAQMMSWPQLFTALIGGMLAWGILKVLRK
jgi:hypothetical protein